MAVSSRAPVATACGPKCSQTRRMNAGSPVESRYVAPAAIAARTATSPHLANGPTVETSVSPSRTAAWTEFSRRTSALTVSRSAPSSSASRLSRSGFRPASTGRSPWATSRLATSPPVKPVPPKRTILRAIGAGHYPAGCRLIATMACNDYRSATRAQRTLANAGGGGKDIQTLSDVTKVSVEIGGTEISFETGKLAKQASGAVVVRAGDTMVLSTATAGNQRDVDFLPLTVDVEERMYAAGKIPGSFFKREGRAGEKGTLVARMIDRPLRPLFPKGWNYETQLVTVPLSVDHTNPYDILGMNGASAALMVSDIPFPEPVGAVRIGKIDGNFVVNPDEAALAEGQSELDLVVSGTAEAILMVEAGASEIPEAEILDALDIAHGEIKKLVAAMNELGEKAGKSPKIEVSAPQIDEGVFNELKGRFGGKLDEATQVFDKLERQAATKAVETEALEALSGGPEEPEYSERLAKAQLAFDKLEKSIIRERIAIHKKRPDGRNTTEIRPISVEAALLPRPPGAALSPRGQPQALPVAPLGTTREEMRLDPRGLETTKSYSPHYTSPPFSVGEAGFMRG